MANLDKVFEIVKKEPVLPVEVASKLNVDSILAKAYLIQLVDSGVIKATQGKIGDVPIFFAPGQELAANAKLKRMLESAKVTAKTFASEVPQQPEIERKRAEFKARLEEIEKKEKLREEKEAPVTISVPLAVQEVEAEVEKPTLPLKDSGSKIKGLAKRAKKFLAGERGSVVNEGLSWLSEIGATIVSKELRKRGKEATIVAKVPSSIGSLKFLIFVISKKKLSESDLSVAYSEGVQKKLPVLILSKGSLSKNAQNYLQVISGVVKFRQLE